LGGIAARTIPEPGHTDHDIAYLIKLTGDANISNLDGDFMATSLRTPAGLSPLQLLAAA
jgi:glyoxylase-like metal-dependent hydrolase (beta-lactamase superfamily II)